MSNSGVEFGRQERDALYATTLPFSGGSVINHPFTPGGCLSTGPVQQMDNSRVVLGTIGRARSGKTSAAEALVAYAESQGLTAGIYDVGKQVLEFCIGLGSLPNKKREDLTREELAELVATGKRMRDLTEDFWIKPLVDQIQDEGKNIAIIPNVRYANEAKAVRDVGGYLIGVKALNRDGSEFISQDRDPNHESETLPARLLPDFFITAFRGEAELIGLQAVQIYEFCKALKGTVQ